MENHVLHTVWCNISGEAAGEVWNWSLLGVKGLKPAEQIHARKDLPYRVQQYDMKCGPVQCSLMGYMPATAV